MGIPFYFKMLMSKYPAISSIRSSADNLFFDFNSIIHQAIQINDANKTVFSMDNIFPHIISQVEDVVNAIKPRESVYLVIDGHCPMAKMHQQRKRRYLSQNMNSLHVTPGTHFMDDLNARLTNYINEKNANTNANKKALCWVLSDSNEEGEGEHKIFQFIKDHNTTDNVVYGLDADLIMLSIIATTHTLQRVSLLRDNVWINIELLINAIKKEYNNIHIDDYIVICMMFGNDFMPPLSYLKVNAQDFDIVLKNFANSITTTSRKYIV